MYRYPGLLVSLLFAALCMATVVNKASAADGTPMYIGSAPADTTPKRDSTIVYYDVTKAPKTDTVYVFAKGKLTRKVAVNQYCEIMDDIAPVFRHVYTIGVWSEVTTEKVMGRMTSHCSGIWRPLASIPAGRRLELHRSNGTVTDVTPRQN